MSLSHSGIFGLGHSHQTYVDAALASRPTPAVCKKLCQAYVDRVHPLVKILHRPSLVAFLLRGESYLDYRDTDPVLDLVRAAVFFLVVATLSNEQCRSSFDTEKASLLATYRLACEVALDRVGLMTTDDMTVLQSLVLYIVRSTKDFRIMADAIYRWLFGYTTTVVLAGLYSPLQLVLAWPWESIRTRPKSPSSNNR